MKLNNLKYTAVAVITALSMSSCDKFLDRPTKDSYNTENFYATPEQCLSSVNYLYNSPWYDFQRAGRTWCSIHNSECIIHNLIIH